MIFIDTNVIIDLSETESEWSKWAAKVVTQAATDDLLVVNHLVLAELHARADTARAFAMLRGELGIKVVALDEPTAVLAGETHGRYRRAGGTRTSIVADFLIGAHAVCLGAPLITRDARRFAGYFPGLTLIAPESPA